jgi:hypothetical protein
MQKSQEEAARIRSCLIYRACIGAISPSVVARSVLFLVIARNVR